MQSRRSARNRRGVETLELILVLPILVILIVFSVQFAMVSFFQSAVVHAATVGARSCTAASELEEAPDPVGRTGIHTRYTLSVNPSRSRVV